jgi:hypothetical protein
MTGSADRHEPAYQPDERFDYSLEGVCPDTAVNLGILECDTSGAWKG